MLAAGFALPLEVLGDLVFVSVLVEDTLSVLELDFSPEEPPELDESDPEDADFFDVADSLLAEAARESFR